MVMRSQLAVLDFNSDSGLEQSLELELLKIYHALYDKWPQKSQYFSYLKMVMRSQLAVLDFNSGSGLEQ